MLVKGGPGNPKIVMDTGQYWPNLGQTLGCLSDESIWEEIGPIVLDLVVMTLCI